MYHNLADAIQWAEKLHAGQTYGEQDYFSAHLVPVESLITHYFDDHRNEFPSNIWDLYITTSKAAYLHDAMEDCGVSKEQIAERYGEDVADLVWRVTDEPGMNRKERKSKTYPKIKESKYATLIKLCDRLHNMRSGGKLLMYVKEYPEFKAALYTQGQFESLWKELDALSTPLN